MEEGLAAWFAVFGSGKGEENLFCQALRVSQQNLENYLRRCKKGKGQGQGRDATNRIA